MYTLLCLWNLNNKLAQCQNLAGSQRVKQLLYFPSRKFNIFQRKVLLILSIDNINIWLHMCFYQKKVTWEFKKNLIYEIKYWYSIWLLSLLQVIYNQLTKISLTELLKTLRYLKDFSRLCVDQLELASGYSLKTSISHWKVGMGLVYLRKITEWS